MRKMIASVCAVLFLGAGTVAGATAVKSLAADDFSWEIDELAESYGYGTIFTLPEGYVTVNGTKVQAKAVLKYPDGTATSALKVKLWQAGVYTVGYFAEKDGKPYSAEKTFNVDGSLLTYGSSSTAEYTTYTKYGCDSYSNNTGLMVRLAQNDTLTINKLIDVNALTVNDLLIGAYAVPDEQGIADFDAINFRLTDSQDDSVYLDINGKRVPGEDWANDLTYWKSAGNGQSLTGYESAGGGYLWVNGKYGAPARHSFAAWDSDNTPIAPARDWIALYYDAASLKTLVASWAPSGNVPDMIIDHDDPAYFQTLWNGFPSGKARLSISASGYNGSTANFMLTDVYGVDLTAETVIDETAPVLKVEREADLPEGKAGGTYKVPKATAVDDYSGVCEVKVSVYYDYLSTTPILVSVKDGKFETNRNGWYGIVYRAEDYFGHSTEKVLMVHVGNPVEELKLFLPDNLAKTCEVGEYVALPEATTTGGSGKITKRAEISKDGIVYGDENGAWIEEPGVYTISYMAEDEVGDFVTETQTLTADVSNQSIFRGEPALAPIYISGGEYILPSFYAYDYTSGKKVEKLCNVTVEDVSGTKILQSGEKFIPTVQNNGDKIKVTYTCGEATMETREIPVIIAKSNDGKLNLSNYFNGNGFLPAATKDGVRITFDGTVIDSGITFANALALTGFAAEITTIPGKGNFKSVKFVLTDAENPELSVCAALENIGGKIFYKVGENSVLLASSFASAESVTHTLSYSDGKISIDGTGFVPDKSVTGKTFNGFESNKIYFSIITEDARKDAAFIIKSIYGHRFNNFPVDSTSPAILPGDNYGGTYALNDTYVLSPVLAVDTLAPNVELKLSVKGLNGEFIRDVNGTVLEEVDGTQEYYVKLAELGQYNISYTAKETNWWNNAASFEYAVSVLDYEKPTITLKREPVKEAKVGDVIVLPDFEVTDNISSTEKIVVCKFVLNPNGRFLKLTGNSIRVAHEGVYEFRILAIDESGNETMLKLYVNVTGEEQ